MRIMLFSATPRSDRGGVQNVLAALETALVAEGVSTLRLGPDEETSALNLRFVAEAGADAEGRPRFTALPGAGAAVVRLATIIARFRPSVVNAHFATGAVLYFLMLRPFFRFRLVLSTHGSDVLRPPPSLRRHLPRFLRSADAVTVVSQPALAAVRAIAPDAVKRLVLVPNGIDARYWTPAGTPSPNRIVAVGRLCEVKGFDILIEALSGLAEAQLTILGEGPARAALEALATRLGVADRLRMPGHLDRQALRDTLRRAAVFAMPSRSEGLPLALLEAMACGLPAVAARVGGVPSVVTPESGVLVAPDDPVALRAALAEALAGTGPASREGARRRAEAFAEHATLDAYIQLFRRLSGEPEHEQ